MLSKLLFDGEYKPKFQYLIEDTLNYDHIQRVLTGNFLFHNSDYLLSPDKIINVEDATFLLIQAMYVSLAFYHQHEENIDFRHFKENLLQKVMLTNINWEFTHYIVKKKDRNNFFLHMDNIKTDSLGRFWFHCNLSISDDKFKGLFSGCILPDDLHKGTHKEG